MSCPLRKCAPGCCLHYAVFAGFLALTLAIWLTHSNQQLFLTINAYHSFIPVWIWESINFIAYRKFMILPGLLLALTYIWRREKLANVVVLIISYFVVFSVLKMLIIDARPYVVLDSNTFYFLDQLENKQAVSYMSFPSGHVGNMAVFAFALNNLFFREHQLLQFTMLMLVVITGLARICTGWHWPLDVLASGLIAYILVKICLCINLRTGFQSWLRMTHKIKIQ